MKPLRWIKKWAWDVWFVKPVEEDMSMYLSHEERLDRLREKVRE